MYSIKIHQELGLLHSQLTDLENSISSKNDSIKWIETRMENRSYRPNFEHCQDEVDSSLKEELSKLKESKEILIVKLNHVK